MEINFSEAAKLLAIILEVFFFGGGGGGGADEFGHDRKLE